MYNKDMLAQRHRFHGHGSLRYVYKHGETVRGRIVTVKYSSNPRRAHTRVSVVVSKKVLKSAVGRNRIRRRVYEIMRDYLPVIEQCGVYDIVLLIFSAEALTMPHDELREIVRQQLSAAAIAI